MAVEVLPARSVERYRSRRLELAGEARRIVRNVIGAFGVTIPGPYTSVLVTDPDSGAMLGWPVTRDVALTITALYRGLAIYADLLGTLPVQRLRGRDRLPLPTFVTAPAGVPVGWTDEIGQLLWSLLLRGNGYARPTTHDYAGFVNSWYSLDPDVVAVEQLAGFGLRYEWPRADGTREVLENPAPDELLHIRWQRPPGSPVGVGILDAQGGPYGTLAGVVATERYATDTMQSPTPPALLEHPLRLKRGQAEDLQAQFMASLGRSRHVPAVLSGGIKYTPLTLTPRDVELIASRRWNATDVAVMLGLPPYLLGGSTGDSLTYSTVEGELSRLWTIALMPAAVRLERAFGAWTPNGQRLRFNPDALLRSQTLDRYQAHKIALEAEFETVDEVREFENLPPLDEELADEAAAAAAVTPASSAGPDRGMP